MLKVAKSRFINWADVWGLAFCASNKRNATYPVGPCAGARRELFDPLPNKCQPGLMADETAHDELPLWRLGPG
jgi:hypothetical protein